MPRALPNPRLVVSRFATVSFRDGKAIVLSSATRLSVEIEDARVLALLHRFAAPARVNDAAATAEERRWIDALTGAGVLVPLRTNRPSESAALRLWEPHDSAYHLLSRTGPGATYRFAGLLKPLPLFKPRMSRRLIRLPQPADEAPRSFWSVLDARMSTRAFARAPMPLERLAALLHHAARDRGAHHAHRAHRDEHGYHLGRRAYPSGGAIYPLEIYPLIPRGACEGIEAGIYHYRPRDHCLERLGDAGRLGALLLKSARRSALLEGRAWILLNITARIGRTSFKYEGIAYSLILKEVGCLFQTLYLTAGALGLGACAVGRGPLDALAELAGLDPAEEPLVGEFVVGAPAPLP